jgi:DNA repair exonuclease SbcCD nuclease subunit
MLGKGIVFSDTHIKPGIVNMEIARAYLFDFLLPKIEEEKPDYIINGGDTGHTKNVVYETVKDLYREFVLELSRRNLISRNKPLYHIVGNHDWAEMYRLHFYDYLKHIPGVVNVGSALRIDSDTVLISYCKEVERFRELLGGLGRRPKRLFGHLDILHFTPGSGYEEVFDSFDPKEFTGIDEVISGHLHKAQDRTIEDTRFIYVGSGYTTDYGESGQPKRVLKLEGNSIVSIDTGMSLHKVSKVTTSDPLPELHLLGLKFGIKQRVIMSGLRPDLDSVKLDPEYSKLIEYIPNEISASVDRIAIQEDDNTDAILARYVSYCVEKGLLKPEDTEVVTNYGKRIVSMARRTK